MAYRRGLANFLTNITKPFDCTTDRVDLARKIALCSDCIFHLHWFAFVLQKGIAQSLVSWNTFRDFSKNSARRSLETKIHPKFFGQKRDDHPIGKRLMHRLDRFANALHETIVVGKRTVYFGKRGRREDYIGESSCFCLEQFLHDDGIKFSQCLNL